MSERGGFGRNLMMQVLRPGCFTLTEKLSCFIDVLKFPTVTGDYDDSDDSHTLAGDLFFFWNV